MRQAADVLSSKAALQLRELDALQNMAKHAGSKVIFVPMHSGWNAVGDASQTSSAQGQAQVPAGPNTAQSALHTGQVANTGLNVAQLNEMAEM